MTNNTPLPVRGYTSQSDAKVTTVNTNKEIEELVLRRLDALQGDAAYDPRWLAIARTDIEKGFMALNRAVFKPERFSGEVGPFHDEAKS